MKSLALLAVGLTMLAFAIPGHAQSSVDCYLKVEGIKGEAGQPRYEDWIELLSFQFSVTNPVGGSGTMGNGRVQFGDLGVSKHIDAASPGLLEMCAKGDPIKEVTLVCLKAGREYFKIKMKDVLVASVQPGWEEGGKMQFPVEEATFHYGAIQWEYTPQRHDGTSEAPLKGGWDTKTGRFAP